MGRDDDAGDGKHWQICGAGLIQQQLQAASATKDERDIIAYCIDCLLDNQMNPEGFTVLKARGRARWSKGESWIVQLPFGWILAFECHPEGLMPIAEPIVRVRNFLRVISGNPPAQETLFPPPNAP